MSNDETKSPFSNFLETYPLYKKLRIKLPSPPSATTIFLWCDACKANRPFAYQSTFIPGTSPTPKPTNIPIGSRTRTLPDLGPPKFFGIINPQYRCTGCSTMIFQFWVELNSEKSWIRKVGQIPEWSIEIPVDLERELGDDAALYKKALILMSQSYGLGACIYLRRIIENHINPMLELILEARKSDGPDEKAAEVKAAIDGRDFSAKIKVAAELLPSSLIVEGENPVKLIYDQLSISIHGLSDDEAMDIAMKVRESFEYVIRELKRQLDSKRKFLEGIKGLRKKD